MTPSAADLTTRKPPRAPLGGEVVPAFPLIIKALVEEAKADTGVKNSLKAPKKEALKRLCAETEKILVRDRAEDFPLTNDECAEILRRLLHRLVFRDKATEFAGEKGQKALVTQVLKEIELALDLGYTPREVEKCLHKTTLTDLTLLSARYPKAIIERALTCPSPLEAAAELSGKRAEHERWIAENSADLKLGSIARLIASKSFRKRVPKDNPMGAAEELLKRFVSDVKWFTKKLPEASARSARHLATRSFYGPLEKRKKILTELTSLEAELIADGRADKYKIRPEILQRTVGIAANPSRKAKELLRDFETEFAALERLIPGQPPTVYRGLAIRAAMTVSPARAERQAAMHGREPVPVASIALAARYEAFMTSHNLHGLPQIGWLLVLAMTLSPEPSERFDSQLKTFRRSLHIVNDKVSDHSLLGAINAELERHPPKQRGFLRRGLLCRFTTLAPGQMKVFGDMRLKIQSELGQKA